MALNGCAYTQTLHQLSTAPLHSGQGPHSAVATPRAGHSSHTLALNHTTRLHVFLRLHIYVPLQHPPVVCTFQRAPASTASCLPPPPFRFVIYRSSETVQSPDSSGNCYYLMNLPALQSLNDVIVSAMLSSADTAARSRSDGSGPDTTQH